jgi:hypothetical protein
MSEPALFKLHLAPVWSTTLDRELEALNIFDPEVPDIDDCQRDLRRRGWNAHSVLGCTDEPVAEIVPNTQPFYGRYST